MKNSGPEYLVIPFVLYNLTGQDRTMIEQVMPPLVTQQLVPGAWKEKWAPMKPFLFD